MRLKYASSKPILHDSQPPRKYSLETASGGESALTENLNTAIRVHVKVVFDRHGQNLAETCKALGISLNTLKKYLRT